MTPIQAFIMVGGEEVTIDTRVGATSATYDPSAPPPVDPTALPGTEGAVLTVYGVYGGIETKDLPAGCIGAFTIEAEDLPANLTPHQSVLTRRETTYVIAGWKERVYRSEIDGYTLHLTSSTQVP